MAEGQSKPARGKYELGDAVVFAISGIAIITVAAMVGFYFHVVAGYAVIFAGVVWVAHCAVWSGKVENRAGRSRVFAFSKRFGRPFKDL